MKLICKTPGNSNPQGKARVWFTGHPAELNIFCEDIFSDIWKVQNCAIYQDAEPASDFEPEELFHELEQMQLIVIPVTSRFLYQKSRARDLELPFAVEHHIPVLPLLQEPELETAFNEQCGNLQLLNKYETDPTALPYAEKLKRFLSTVLVGDELAKKVRAAFDAYVFLSYRKKDRRYAQELMRLIHKNDFCRDIAIWYDEFLTPGEDFNEAIADAMKKCSVFTLAVTPNIVEPGNYVMMLEYPEAKRSDKPVLPVELIPTEKEMLNESFPQLPPCTDAYDEQALSAALLHTVQRLAIRENDRDPEHNFFIGLAYLNGIDVEVDRSRACELITGAAEENLPEAMEKLIGMYRSGEGVARSYHTALSWQERLAEHLKSVYEASPAEEEGIRLGRALCRLGEYRQELSLLSAAREAYQEMLSLNEHLQDACGSDRTASNIARACLGLGDICIAEQQHKQARAYYLRTLAFAQKQFETDSGIQAKNNLFCAYFRLGRLCEAEGNITAAKEYYQKSLSLCNALYEQEKTATMRQSLSLVCDTLGTLYCSENESSKAKEYYLQSFTLRRQAAEETETAADKAELGVSCNHLVNICAREGAFTSAETYARMGLKLLKEGYEELGTIQSMRDLMICHHKLGELYRQEKKWDTAKKHLLQEFNLAGRLCQETGTVRAKRDLGLCYDNLGWLSETTEEPERAREYYLKELAIYQELHARTHTLKATEDLAASCYHLGHVCQTLNEPGMAEEYYLKCLDLRMEIYDKSRSIDARNKLAVTYSYLGGICTARKEYGKAEEYYLCGLKLSEELYEENDTGDAAQYLAIDYNTLAEFYRTLGNLSMSEKYFSQSLSLRKKFHEQTRTPRAKLDIADCCNSLGDICKEMGKSHAAGSHYREALAILQKLCEQEDTPRTRERLLYGYAYLGDFYREQGDTAAAKKQYLQLLPLAQQLHKTAPSIQLSRTLCIVSNILGVIEAQENNRSQAFHYCCEARNYGTALCQAGSNTSDCYQTFLACLNAGILAEQKDARKIQLLEQACSCLDILDNEYAGNPAYTKQADMARRELEAIKNRNLR